MPTSLPTEITDGIIDCVHDDLRTVRSCSLTCRSWRARAQYHLFAYVNLKIRKPQQIERLSAVLTESPHLAAHFRRIKLPVTLEHCAPFLAVCPLPLVEELSLLEPAGTDRCILMHSGNPWFSRLGAAFPNARSLVCLHIRFRGFSVLLELLSAFPRLDAVDLYDVLVEPVLDDPLVAGAHGPSLLSLTLNRCSTYMADDWLHPCVFPLVQGLRHLKVYQQPRHEIHYGYIGSLAGRLSHSLYELVIEVMAVKQAKDIIAGYCDNRSPSPVLRRLRIIINPHILASIDRDLSALLMQMRGMDMDSRARVEVIVYHHGPHALEWEAVKEELSRTPFPCQLSLSGPGLIYGSEQD